MKKGDLLNLAMFLQGLMSRERGNKVLNAKFLYALKRNLELVREKVNTIHEEINNLRKEEKKDVELDKSLSEFEKERQELLKANGKKDENGELILTEDKRNYVLEDPKKFNEEYKTLEEKYKDTIDKFRKRKEILNNLLMEDINNIEFYKIKVDWLPDQGLSSDEVDLIYELVEE
jgi:hypothetical protein